MQSLIANPKKILDFIGWHLAKKRRSPDHMPFLFIRDGEDYYCLKISGDSIRVAPGEDDETVFVKRTEKIKNNDIIVGVVDGEPMLKRYKKFENRIELHSANSSGHPIIVTEENDFRVAGIFISQFNEF